MIDDAQEVHMPTISRRTGETIAISDDVKITVVHTQKGQVKLAIEAPDDVVVLREEVLLKAEKDQLKLHAE